MQKNGLMYVSCQKKYHVEEKNPVRKIIHIVDQVKELHQKLQKLQMNYQ